MQSGDKRGQDGQDRNHIWKGKDAGGWGDISAGRGCEPGSCAGYGGGGDSLPRYA